YYTYSIHTLTDLIFLSVPYQGTAYAFHVRHRGNSWCTWLAARQHNQRHIRQRASSFELGLT
ncbi:MAG: hypothetical protein KAS38_08095, partial [Anaerolineales bacterium]|nr:hypothetical protein [Anaerolineales bacterium]